MITLKLYDGIDIETTTIDGKRHYLTPDGVFPSVTTVLSNKLDKSGLEKWRARVGEEEAAKISTQAANRGTAIHDMAENDLCALTELIEPSSRKVAQLQTSLWELLLQA